MNKVLLIIDMQNDFIDGSLGTPEARAVVPKVVARAAAAEANGEALIFTQDTHTPAYLATQEGRHLPVEHCIKPSNGWEICPSLAAYAAKAVCIEKPAFGSTKLAEAVKDYDEITLVGLCTDICVISNALLLKAFYPEKHILVDSGCCAGVTPQSHENALAAMKSCQVDILAPEEGGVAAAHRLTADGKVIAAGTLEDIAYAVLQTSETTFLDVATYALLDWTDDAAQQIEQEKIAGSQWVYIADGKPVYIADEAMLKTLIRQKMTESGMQHCQLE